MKVYKLHSWQISIVQAKEIQRKLANQVSRENDKLNPRLIAGVDISSSDSTGTACGAVVILHYPELKIVETKTAEAKLGFPYIPGLLSFREAPLILAACEKLSNPPDLILVDGQGIAHPRRLGLASHLGLFLDTPTVGCAKSILCGRHEPVDTEANSHAELIDHEEVVGAALRTKTGIKPIYISVGHKINLTAAIYWVMQCCRGYRLPEPCRLAHLVAGGKLASSTSTPSQSYQERLFI